MGSSSLCLFAWDWFRQSVALPSQADVPDDPRDGQSQIAAARMSVVTEVEAWQETDVDVVLGRLFVKVLA